MKKEVKPSEGVITDYNVSTSNSYVAIIDARGKIKPLHIGKCTLVLTSKTDDTKKETYKLCVTDEFVAEDGYNFYKEDIAHGEVSDFTYPSQYRESGEGHAKIYFPPDYDPKIRHIICCSVCTVADKMRIIGLAEERLQPEPDVMQTILWTICMIRKRRKSVL